MSFLGEFGSSHVSVQAQHPFFFSLSLSSVFNGLLSSPFAFLPWECFGNEGDTGWEDGGVVLSGSVPKSS